jgi:cytochrome P450 family 6
LSKKFDKKFNFFPSGISKKFHQFEIHQKIYEKFKNSKNPFTGIFAFLEPVVLVTNLDMVRSVFTKDSSNFIDRGAYYNEKDNPLSAHIFNLDNPKWRILRTKLTPTFTSGKMKMMFGTVVEVGERFIKKMESEVEIGNGNEMNVKEFAARFTTDVIGELKKVKKLI